MDADTVMLSTVNVRLRGRRDVASLVSELIGSSELDRANSGPSSHHWTHARARRLLIRIQILFELQLRHHADAAFADNNGGTDPDLLAGPECAFETTIYLLQLGARLEPPGAVGRSDYSLCRRLVLDAFLASLRAWCLHRERMTYEQEDHLRRKIEELWGGWNHIQALSGLEDLILRRMLPPLLDEIREQAGQSEIQDIACGRFSLASFQADRTPFCRTPSLVSSRQSAVRACFDCMVSITSELTEMNYIQGFWTCYDALSYLRDSIVLWNTNTVPAGGAPARGKSVGMLVTDLHLEIARLSAEKNPNSAQGIVSFYFCEMTSFLATKASGMESFHHDATSDRLRRGIQAELAEFLGSLARRDAVLQRQFSSARPDEAPRPLDHVTIPTPQVPTATDRNYPNISTTAQGPPSDNQAFKDDTSFGGQPHPHPLVPGSQAVGQSPVLSRLMSTYGTPSVSPSTDYQPGLAHPAEQARNSTPSNLRGWPESPYDSAGPADSRSWLHSASPAPLTWSSSSPVSAAAVSPAYPAAQTLNRAIPSPPPPGINMAFQHNSAFPNDVARPPPPVPGAAQASPTSGWHSSVVPPPYHKRYSDDQSAATAYHLAGQESQPGLEVVSHHTTPHTTIFSVGGPDGAPPPPPSRPTPALPTSPVFESHELRRPQSITSPSISASSRSGPKKTGFFSKLSGKSSAARQPIPVDLQFRFSAAGTSLLLWTKKDCQGITLIYRPSPHAAWAGHRLHLQPSAPSPGAGPEPTSAPSVRLAEGGTRGVACVVYEGYGLKLLWFDAAGRCLQHPLGDLRSVPSALAVARDDTRVALACGGAIQLFSVAQGELRPVATLQAHSAAYEYPEDSRRIHRLGFSTDSKRLLAATQEYVNSHRRPVTVRIWDCFGKDVSLNRELDPIWLGLGNGDDTGLTGIFYGLDNPADEDSARMFLTAAVSKSYAALLPLGSEGRNRHLDVKDKRVECAAQAAGGAVAFKSGRHQLCLLDRRFGQVRPLVDLAADRAKLKPRQEPMALGMPTDGLVLAVWAAADGGLALRQVELADDTVHVTGFDLRDVYFEAGTL